MATLTLQLSDKQTLTLPADLAHQAGLEEGEVQIILGDRSLTVTPVQPLSEYDRCWATLSATLRDQATLFGLDFHDRRDSTYWEIVTPLFEEVDRTLGLA